MKNLCIILVIVALYLFVGSAFAQEQEAAQIDSTIQKELALKCNVSQLSFTNWAQGGDNSLAYTASVVGEFKKQCPKINWLLKHEFIFGQTKLGEQGIRNTIDKIDIFGNIALNKKILNPFFSVSFLTQFAKGYDYSADPKIAKSDFWDPAYLTESLGLSYAPKPNFINKLGFAVKETFTRNFNGYSDDAETVEIEKYSIEPGLSYRSDLSLTMNTKIKYSTILEIFSNMSAFDEVDVRWDNKVDIELTKFIAAELSVYLLYDKNMTAKTQIKQFLGIGVVYNVFGD